MVSLEAQGYPTGFIPGLTADFPVAEAAFLHLRLGANLFDHRDLGKQDMEEGSGVGGSFGYRRFFSKAKRTWRWGIRTDIWFNKVDWSNRESNGELVDGQTDITVLQPTAELSYVLRSGQFIIAPSLAFGLEWNVRTAGRETGEGPIILLGVQLGRAF